MRDKDDPEIDAQIEAFADAMRSERHRAGLSQVEMSEATGLDRGAISFLERAERCPDLGTLLRVARALETTGADLLRGIGVRDSRVLGPRPGSDMPRDPAQGFGRNLRWARKRAEISQETLARRARVDRAAISIYERGVREPNLRTVLKLARALELRASALLRGIE